MTSRLNLSQSELSLQPQIKSVFEYSFILTNGEKYCRRCEKKFTSSDFSSHQKNCLRNSTKKQTKSLTFSCSDVEKKSLFSSSVESSVDKKPEYAQAIVDTITQAMVGVLRASVVLFVDKNRHLSNDALFHIIMSKSMEFNKTLGNIFKEDELKDIQNNRYIASIINTISDIFDVSLIEGKISNFSKNKQQKIRNMLNKMMKDKGLPQIYQKNPLQFETEQAKLPLMFSQFRSFIVSLLKTKLKNYIHIALDLLIIFHSQQRMPSSTTIVKEAIVQILKSDSTYATIKSAMKQKTKQLLVINKQLKSWLKEFNWTDFFLSQRALGRVSSFLNFSLISLRKGLYCQIYIHIFKAPVKHMTFHKVEASVDYYLSSLRRALLQQFHQKLDIFNQKYQIVDMDKIIPKLIKLIPGTDIPYQLSQFNQIAQEDIIIERKQNEDQQQQIQQIQQNQQLKQNELDSQEQSEKMEETIEKIKILEMEYQISKGQFKSSIFEDLKSNQFCKTCKKSKCEKICLFCLSHYHLQCLPEFCWCMKFVSPQAYIRVEERVLKTTNYLINLPENYFIKNTHYLSELRKLIHLRGFYFCTAGINRFSHDLICSVPNIQQIKIPNYDLYEKGQYCPPIIFAPSGDHNLYGTGVGIFAAEKIQKGIFIGEYGGTIVEEDQLILLKRKDMSMKFCELDNKVLYIGADHHCSYVQLINGCNAQKANCKIISLAVNGKLKLILCTIKQIGVGQELVYNYGKGFQVKYETKLREQVSILNKDQDQIDVSNYLINLNPSLGQNFIELQNKNQQQYSNEMINEESYEQQQVEPIQNMQKSGQNKKPPRRNIRNIRIQKCRNSCYADTVIVILKMLWKYIPKYSTKTLTRALLSSKEFKIKRYVQQFEKMRNNAIKNMQQDFDQFFIFLNGMLQIDCPFDKVVVEEVYVCEGCSKETKVLSYETQFRIHQLKISLQEQYTVQKKCSNCSASTEKNHLVKRSVLSTPPLIILNYASTYHDGTKRVNIIQVRKIKHNQFIYNPKLVAYHHGQSASSGHFVTLDFETNVVYDAGKCRNFDPLQDFHVCMVILQKAEVKQVQNHLVDKDLKDCGIFVSIEQKIDIRQNLDTYYNIASIVKIITYLTCQKIAASLGIDKATTTFSAPKCSQLFGTVAGLRQNHRYTLSELYHFMLINSACDAAYTLAVRFGDLIRETKNYTSEQLFIKQMAKVCFQLNMYNTIVEDPCGLKKNVSCVRDLLLLIDQATKNPNYIEISKKGSYNGVENSNIFSDLLIGKTGTHRGGFCFLGKNLQNKIVLLNINTKQRRQQLISQWLNYNS